MKKALNTRAFVVSTGKAALDLYRNVQWIKAHLTVFGYALFCSSRTQIALDSFQTKKHLLRKVL
jgi:hypothetical protein